jgi:Zn-dependent protease
VPEVHILSSRNDGDREPVKAIFCKDVLCKTFFLRRGHIAEALQKGRFSETQGWSLMNSLDLPTIARMLPGIIAGLTFHEFMHGFVAFRCGDPTARDEGRLSLNPLRHIDWIGFLFIVIAGFGWAKPVHINREQLQHPRRDEILISIAGPFANLTLGILLSALLRIILLVRPFDGDPVYNVFLDVMILGAYVNYGLFVFNMLPFPPLDGSHVFLQFLRVSDAVASKFYKYGTIALFGILIIESQAHITLLPISAAVRWIANTVFGIFGFSM